MIQKYIISGAPGTGKTTIINALKKKDHYCAEEISRELIAEQISIGGNILPWKDQIAFENKIAHRRYKQYLDSPENCICFFDRSSIDCIAYLNNNKLESTSQINQIIKNCIFNKTVFYTPIWEEIYKNDSERQESFDQSIRIDKYLKDSYMKFGYTIIKIPKTTLDKRVNFILSQIKD